jgi:hypothetical protein
MVGVAVVGGPPGDGVILRGVLSGRWRLCPGAEILGAGVLAGDDRYPEGALRDIRSWR